MIVFYHEAPIAAKARWLVVHVLLVMYWMESRRLLISFSS